MGTDTRIHLGAGHYFWPGYQNHDEEVDLWNLPYADGSVEEIHCIHLFEHLPRLKVDEALQEWRRVLTPNGLLAMELPSLDKMARLICEGEENQRLTLLGIFGDPRDWDTRPLMRHEWAWTDKELETVLTNNGFAVEFQTPIYHIEARDMRIEGRKQ